MDLQTATVSRDESKNIFIEGSGRVLSIARATGTVETAAQVPSGIQDKVSCVGILGLAKLPSASCLILVNKIEYVGTFVGHSIGKIVATSLYPNRETILSQVTEDKEKAACEKGIDYLNTILDVGHFYTSFVDRQNEKSAKFALPTWSIGCTVQDACKAFLNENQKTPIWNPVYVWNQHLKQPFEGVNTEGLLMNITRGFISMPPLTVNGETIKYILISRLQTPRVGHRLQRRGADENGNVANSVETEFSFAVEKEAQTHLCSYIQLRGSVPLPWLQIPDLKYKPPVQFPLNREASVATAKVALEKMHATYGGVTLVNLLDDRKHEAQLCLSYTQIMEDLVKEPAFGAWLQYHYFDFHHICRKMRFERVSLLLPVVEAAQKDYGFFYFTHDKESSANTIHREQRGIFRVNCLDSLDRTGIVQHLLGTLAFRQQLEQCGIVKADTAAPAAAAAAPAAGHGHDDIPAPPFPTTTAADVDAMMKIVWSDNACAMAMVNTGTPAMKSDYTRTGKRTAMGALNDGIIGVKRYLVNGFVQPRTQDAMDFWLGKASTEHLRRAVNPLAATTTSSSSSSSSAAAESSPNPFTSPIAQKLAPQPPTSLSPLKFYFSVMFGFLFFVFILTSIVAPKPSVSMPRLPFGKFFDRILFVLVAALCGYPLFTYVLFPQMRRRHPLIIAHSQLLGDEYVAHAEKAGGADKFLKTLVEPREDAKKEQ